MNEAQGRRRVGRSILAVVAGALVAGVLVMTLEGVGHAVYPLAPGLDPRNPEDVKAMIKDMPAGALAFVLLAWLVGTLAGAWVAAKVAPRKHLAHAMVVGVLQLAGGVANLVMIPHPTWFAILGVLVFLPAAYLGARLGHRGKAAQEQGL